MNPDASPSPVPVPSARAKAVAGAFTRWAGRAPEGVWSAPGRVNLIGEHLDYNGGHVLPFAIEAAAWLAVGRRTDGIVRVTSTRERDAVTSAVADLRASTGWSSYVLGTLWALSCADVHLGGADLYLDSDVPPGAGLSSSAAIEVAVAVAADDLTGADLGDERLAQIAHRAETEVVGAPVGIMDQTTSLQARGGHVIHLDCRTLAVEHIPLVPERANQQLLVVDTGDPHELRSGGYGDRRRACERAARAAGTDWLARASPEQVARARLPAELERRARHVVSEEARTIEAARLLRAGDIAALGPLLTDSHRSQRDDFEVSTPALDATVDAAVRAGAAGARLTGGGFGGNALILAPSTAVDDVRRAVTATLRPLLGVDPDIRPVRPGPGARRVL